MKRSTSKLRNVIGVSSTVIALCPLAQAESELSLEEVVVTARHRTEKLSDAPLTVTAFGEAAITRSGIKRPADFIALTPNIGFSQTTNAGDTAVHIRGIIQPRDTEPPYALIIDGVLTPNTNALNRELVDIEQIEILKGPQGALYGRNAIGGAIIINTKQPGNEFEGSVEGGYGRGSEATFRASVSGPIIEDKLFYRLSASHYDREGYYNNITRGNHVDPFREKTVRARLLWNATDKLTFDARYDYGRIDGYAINFNGQADIFLPFLPGSPEDITGVAKLGGGVDSNDTSAPYFTNVKDINVQHRKDFALKMEYEADYGTWTAVASYSDLEEPAGGDGPVNLSLFGLNAPGATEIFLDPDNSQISYSETRNENPQVQNRNQEDASIDIRFASPGENRLRYIVGGYFVDIEREVILGQVADLNDVVLPNPINGPDSLSPTVVLSQWSLFENKAWAVYANVNYDITDDLELAVAARYDKEDRDATSLVPNIPTPFEGDDPSVFLTNVPDGDPSRFRNETFDEFQPKVSLRYRLTDDHTVYASYGKAFRSGGFNALGSRALVQQFTPDTPIQDEFPSETSTSFEIGAKTSWWDNRIKANVAAFFTEVENAHNFQFDPISFARVVTLVDESEILGFEFDAKALLTDRLEVGASFGILDSELVKNDPDPSVEGNEQAYTPDYNVNLSAQYILPLSDGVDVVFHVDAERIGEQWFNIENTPGTERDAVDLVNARISVETENWEVALWGKNIFDERYNTDAVVLPATFGNFNFVTRAIPATYGLTAQYNF